MGGARRGFRVPRRDHVLYQQVNSEDREQQSVGKEFRVGPNRMELSVHNRGLFLGALAAVQVPGLAAVIMTITWVEHFKGGVVWGVKDKGIVFNWHPILMTLGLIFLYGNGALIYRILPAKNESHKLKLKIAHAIVMMVVFIMMIIGLQA